MNQTSTLLRLLQLASPALPVGAYSYSEGLEWLVETGKMTHVDDLAHWLTQELRLGSIRVDAAVMVRGYRSSLLYDLDSLRRWNVWLSAVRETEELRSQSLQMGRSLLRLFQDIDSQNTNSQNTNSQNTSSQNTSSQNTNSQNTNSQNTNSQNTNCSAPEFPAANISTSLLTALPDCHFAIAFGLVAAHWQIDEHSATLGYLYSWVSNLISAGIKLIPLGQTTGQQLLLKMQPVIEEAITEILALQDEELVACSWGLSLASMAHETQYSRLFRS